MWRNYYIDKNGDYVQKPPEQNFWKEGFNRNGFYAMKRYKIKVSKRRSSFAKFKNKIKSILKSIF